MEKLITPDARNLIRLYSSPNMEEKFINAIWEFMQQEKRKEREMIEERYKTKSKKRRRELRKIVPRKNWNVMTYQDVSAYILNICSNGNLSFEEKKRYLIHHLKQKT